MTYLILSQPSTDYARALSAALWSISRPPAVNKPEDTQLYTGWITHPETGEVALFVPDDTRPVHVDADLQPLLDLIEPAVTPDELEAITDAVEGARGGRISFKSLLEGSPSLSEALHTREALDADGWFPTDDI